MTEKLTVRELVRQLGGANQVAAELSISSQAVCNWYTAGIAKRHHLALWTLCRAKGIRWQPPGADALLAQPSAGPLAPVTGDEARQAA